MAAQASDAFVRYGIYHFFFSSPIAVVLFILFIPLFLILIITVFHTRTIHEPGK